MENSMEGKNSEDDVILDQINNTLHKKPINITHIEENCSDS